MKKFTKLLGIVLIFALVMSISVSAFAATITINQPDTVDGTVGAETYNLYKIFDVTKTDAQADWETNDSDLGPGEEEGFSYTISTTSPWFAVLGSVTEGTWAAASGQSWVTLTKSAGDDTLYNVTYTGANTEAGAKAFAEWLYSKKGSITADQTMTSSSGAAVKADVADGYWLIDSSLGTALVLATSDTEITTKNQYVTDEKTVAKTNYNVGDMVEYTIVVNLPATIDYSKSVVVHDTLDDVLLFQDDVAATSGANKAAATAEGADEYTAFTVAKTGLDDDCTFEITMDISEFEPAANADPEAVTVVFTYTAELTSAAAADHGYVNEEFTEYSKYKTTPNDVEVKTYDFDLTKTFTGNTDKALQATFNLYATETTTTTDSESGKETSSTAKATTPIKFIDGGTITGKDVTYVKVDSDDGAGSADILVKVDATNKSLVTNVRGLAEGTYYLTETATADGYNMLTGDVVIVIDANGNVTYSGAASGSGVITVENNSGTVLPSTGGIGTTIFYVVGSVLVIAAGVLLVTKKRMGRD